MLIQCPSGKVFSTEHERFVTLELLGPVWCRHCDTNFHYVAADVRGYLVACTNCGGRVLLRQRYLEACAKACATDQQ
jgi:DNA-directed RNA polymerase subunit RPC12/RpoP